MAIESAHEESPWNIPKTKKLMTFGEGSLAAMFAALVLFCIVAAANAQDEAFRFHAWLAAAASLGASFAIFNRYFDRPAVCHRAKLTAGRITISGRSSSPRSWRYSGESQDSQWAC